MKKATLWVLFILLFSQKPSLASDARVDGMGGLTLVATDEADTVNPFILGNPAGLALLTPQTRFDVGTQWYAMSFTDGETGYHIYGTMNQLNSDDVKYHGLMFFPSSNWAIQVDADALHTENENSLSNHIDDQDRTRELLRTAYNFGPFTLGGEIHPTQANIVYGSYKRDLNNQITSGTGTVDSFSGTAGLLIDFNGNNDPKQAHFRIGGSLAIPLSTTQQINHLFDINGGNTANLTDTFTDTHLLTWGPEIYLQIPGTFEAAAIGRFVDFNVSFQEDSSDQTTIASTPNYNIENGNAAIGILAFKMTNPLVSSVNLKSGGFFTLENSNTVSFQSGGTSSGGATITTWNAQIGLGLEKSQDFTFGAQTSLKGSNGFQGPSASSNIVDSFDYTISIGGEHWFSRNWAFRMGYVYDNNKDTGDVPVDTFLFSFDSNVRVATDTIIAGIGYQATGFKMDLDLSWGQPVIDENSSAFVDIYGAQLSTSLIFNPIYWQYSNHVSIFADKEVVGVGVERSGRFMRLPTLYPNVLLNVPTDPMDIVTATSGQ